MTKRLSIIAPFLLITILATGSVELFCRSLDQALTAATSPATAPNSDRPHTAAVTQNSEPLKITPAKTASETYAIITSRNLFGKPLDKNSETAPPLPPDLEATSLDLTLLGTISGDDNAQRAIIQDKRKKTQEIYQKDKTVGPALIKEILRDKVILTVKGKDEVLLMEERKSVHSPGSAVRSAPSRIRPVRKAPVQEPEEEPELELEADLDPDTLVDESELEETTEESEENPALPSPKRRIFTKKNNNQEVEP